MEIYILDNKNLNVLSVCRPCSYNLNLDEETNGKTELVLPSLKYARKGYYLVLETQEISKRKLADIGKKYNSDLTISVLQAQY